VANNKITIDEAKRMACCRINNVSYGKNDYIFAIDAKYNLIVHPDPHMINVNLYNLQDVDGIFVVRKLVEAAMSNTDKIGFVQYIIMCNFVVVLEEGKGGGYGEQ